MTITSRGETKNQIGEPMTGLSKTEFEFVQNWKTVQARMHETSKASGFWDEADQLITAAISAGRGDLTSYIEGLISGQKIALIHSEISEALEGNRKSLSDDKLPARPMEEVELADAVIRIMDYAERKGYDVAGALIEKASFNKTRPYKHGKEY